MYSKTTTPPTALKQPPPPFPNSCPSLNLQLIFYSFFPLFWLPLELNITVGSTTLIENQAECGGFAGVCACADSFGHHQSQRELCCPAPLSWLCGSHEVVI